MYKPNKKIIIDMDEDVEIYEGESIETKVARMIETNEPITDSAPIIYTEKKDGVRPEFDIRTDKWEIAQNAMDNVNKSKIAKSKQFLQEPEDEQKQYPNETGGKEQKND